MTVTMIGQNESLTNVSSLLGHNQMQLVISPLQESLPIFRATFRNGAEHRRQVIVVAVRFGETGKKTRGGIHLHAMKGRMEIFRGPIRGEDGTEFQSRIDYDGETDGMSAFSVQLVCPATTFDLLCPPAGGLTLGEVVVEVDTEGFKAFDHDKGWDTETFPWLKITEVVMVFPLPFAAKPG